MTITECPGGLSLLSCDNGGSGGSGVTQIVAGTNVTISPVGGTGTVTINSSGSGGGAVDSVTGLNTDNADPANPVVKISVDGVTITGSGTPADPLVGTGGSPITFETDGTPNTDQTTLNLISGTNITLTADMSGGVTIDSSGGGSISQATFNIIG